MRRVLGLLVLLVPGLTLGFGPVIQAATQPRPAVVTVDPDEGFTDGQAITIDGEGFGTFTGTRMSIEDDLEAASNGTHVLEIPALESGGWVDPDGNESSTGRWHNVSTSGPLVGSKVILAQSFGSDGRFGMAWDTGATFSRVFMRDYVRISSDDATPQGQWKMVRFTSQSCVTDDDRTNNYFANWHGAGFDFLQSNEGPGCGGGGADNIDSASGDFNTHFGVWYEREIEMVFGTTGGANGIGQIRFRRVSDWTEVSNLSHTGFVNFSASNSTNRPRYIVYHDYQGNGLAEGGVHSAVRIDVPFAQVGSRQRVYISPQATWALVRSAGPRELLDRVTSWSNTQITGQLRQGILTLSHMAGTLYAYVIDDNGSPVDTDGIPITSLFDVLRPANDDQFEVEPIVWAA